MLKYLEIISFVLALAPKIIEIVSSVEKMFPEGGAGAQKLELVKGMLQAAFDTLGNAKISFEEMWPTVQKIVASVVSFANSVGLFKKNA
jgi:hypothetical protein